MLMQHCSCPGTDQQQSSWQPGSPLHAEIMLAAFIRLPALSMSATSNVTTDVNSGSKQQQHTAGEGGRRYPAGNWLFCIHVTSERRERRFMEAHMLATATRIIFHIRILGVFHVPVEATLVRLSHNLDVCCLLFLSLSYSHSVSY